MAFKLNTSKTVNKVLAGAGIAALAGTAITYLAPGYIDSPMAKAAEGIIAYGVGGVESLVGAAATMFIGGTAAKGVRSLDNTLTETL